MRRNTKLDRALDAFERCDWKRARRLFEDSLLEEERAIAQYHLGLLYWRGLGGSPDKAAAVDCFARAAEEGYPRAQTAYGIAMRSGVGVAKNTDLARQHFRSAAGAGDGEAMVQIASMSEPDDTRRWLTRAAEMGYAPAMLHLADLLMPLNPVEALTWLYASVTLSGDDASRKRAAALAREMSAREIDVAQRAGRAIAKSVKTRVEGSP